MKIFKSLFVVITIATLAACSGGNKASTTGDQQNYPVSTRKRLEAERGKLTGEDGITLLGGQVDMNKKSSGRVISRGVNSYLWQASLDTISFMPIASVDAAGGVIITDWYQDPNSTSEKLKANIVISSDELRASGLRVTLFRQVATSTGWKDAAINPDVSHKLEDRILTRARELKIEDDRF